jgi:sigma-B regulation protein RsbU (phosphoserine phosphatase)
MKDPATKAHILVVDDNEDNREVLVRLLQRQGHSIALAENGQQAMELISQSRFDLVLLDIMMPVMDGFEVLTRLNEDGTLRNLPVIVVSAGTAMDQVIRCIELGADDYLNKPFKSSLLKARIGSSLEKKFLRDAQLRTQKALETVNRRLRTELLEAADYVRSLLPLVLQGEVSTDWQFFPSIYLGGDSFGYHWIDQDHFAMYLLDVCGHGVGAALLSITVMDVLNSLSLSDTDFLNPSSVLSALNRMYPMEKHNGKFFTMWYGIYDKRDFSLTYSSGGHPPAVLVDSKNQRKLLKTSGPSIGLIPVASYTSATVRVEQPSKLMLFSDGVYENKKMDGSIMSLEEFLEQLESMPWDTSSETLLNLIRTLCPFPFEDDFSLVQVIFQKSG